MLVTYKECCCKFHSSRWTNLHCHYILFQSLFYLLFQMLFYLYTAACLFTHSHLCCLLCYFIQFVSYMSHSFLNLTKHHTCPVSHRASDEFVSRNFFFQIMSSNKQYRGSWSSGYKMSVSYVICYSVRPGVV